MSANERLGALIEEKSEEPFTLVILGEVEGKSTIINALLGKELAPINVTTTNIL